MTLKTGMVSLSTLLALLFSTSSFAIYKCVDEQGQVSYQQSRCDPVPQRRAERPAVRESAEGDYGLEFHELQFGPEHSVSFALPKDWTVSITDEAFPRGAKTIRATPPSGEELSLLITAFRRQPGDQRAPEQLLGELRDSVEMQHMKVLDSALIESKPLPLALTPGAAHIYTFQDRKLVGLKELPKGEYRYVIPAQIVTDSMIANATILLNDLATPGIDAARLSLSMLHLEEPLVLPSPPAGYQWVEIPAMKAAFLKPAGWFDKVASDGELIGLYAAKEAFDEENKFLTGLSVIVSPRAKIVRESGAELVAEAFLQEYIQSGKALGAPERSQRGPFFVSSVTVKREDDKLGDYIMASGVVVNELTGTIYQILFEAPEADWEAVWSAHGETLTTQFFLESLR